MNILIPVDGSERSLRAIEHVINQRSQFVQPLTIHLLHVHPPIPIGRVQSHIGAETLKQYYLDDSQAALAGAEERLRTAGLDFVRHLHVGQPPEVIAHQAVALGCDQILMATHGHGALAGLTLGSVATRVVHLAACPVLLVK